MGSRGAVLVGFVLLLAGGHLGSAAQNRVVFGTNETLHETKPEAEVKGSQQANQTEQKPRSPVTYRLKTYQLQSPVHPDKQKLLVEEKTFQVTNALEPTSELLEQKKTVKSEKALLVRSSNLNLPTSEPANKEPKVEQQLPAPARSVSVECGEGKAFVEVKQDFLGNGQLIRPSDLTLGGCSAMGTVDGVLLFQTELHGCGSTTTMTETSIIYTFTLTYSPTPITNTSILKTNPAEATVQCHFYRRSYASSNAVRPTWTTVAMEMQAKQQFRFSQRLMTEDWLSPRPSNVYFLSDTIHIEVAVLRGFHIPLRAFVDSCVATMNSDPGSALRYAFITNHGCLTDSKLTGAKSFFLSRSQEDKLNFQLKAFKFPQQDKNSVHITCHLKATALGGPIDTQHKACSYLTEAGRWVASGGDNNVCSCCETSCEGPRQKRSLAADAALNWEGTAALSPILMEDVIRQEEFPPKQFPQLQT
ncbi:zona pellucida sperm-binding protein 3 [Nematolebias whitei]|uniref:zona pellucida sperm-binding protein 3 n=1 Tax=Nematolebias whitei TaxID=451745 RepID=UPI00189C5562|nr:zona pellucida sperm-binding protein 3 [Nematolebias whitei]